MSLKDFRHLMLISLTGFGLFIFETRYRSKLIAKGAEALVKHFPSHTRSWMDSLMVWGVTLFGTSAIMVYLVIASLMRMDITAPFIQRWRPALFIWGILLGLGQTSVCYLLSTFALRTGLSCRWQQVGDKVLLELQILGQTGWMRCYYSAIKTLPFPLNYGVVALALLGEELIFRGLFIPLLLPLGPTVAIGLTTAFFILEQYLGMPSWYQALAPISAALVMGLVNGYLFILEPNLIPLVIGHFIFFLLLTAQPRAGTSNFRQCYLG